MKISLLKQAIMLCREAGVTPFVWGYHGLGKSSAVRQACEENELGFVDLRCSQMEASDLRGLPDRVNGQTVYLPPQDMPLGGMTWEEMMVQIDAAPQSEKYKTYIKCSTSLNEGMLFLDEINRAQDDVLQAAFQLVLDRAIGQYVMPTGWSVVCAGNYTEGYLVNGFTDPAFLDRFCHLQLSAGESTMEEWASFIAQNYGEDGMSVIEFATQNTAHLDGKLEGEMGFNIQPSRRSWEAVVRVDKAIATSKREYSEDTRSAVIAGLIGMEFGAAYVNYECPVKPKDILTKGVKKMEKALKGLKRGQVVGLMWGLASFIAPKLEEDNRAEVALDFAEFLLNTANDRDLAIAFCKSLTTSNDPNEKSKLRIAALSNPQVARLINQVQSQHGTASKKDFITRINERPALQKLLSNTAWAKDE